MNITIVIPVYKVELYVRKCIESIIDQEKCGASIECIVVDDCGQDDSMSIIHSVVDEYTGPIRFVFLKHDRNRGLSAARNTGMDAATGDYILFVDSDDWLPAGALSKYVSALQRYPDLDMVIGNYYISNADTLFYDVDKELLFDNYHARRFLVSYKEGACSAWAKLVKSEIAKNNRFIEGVIFEDKPWTYSVFKKVRQALLIPDRTYTYESGHPSSILDTLVKKTDTPRHVRSIVCVSNAILDAPYKDLFTESIFFFWHYYFVAFRMQYEHELGEDERRQLRQLRNRIVRTSIKKGRLFLALFVSTLTCSPLFNTTWGRRHYDMIMRTGRYIAFFLEKFHK